MKTEGKHLNTRCLLFENCIDEIKQRSIENHGDVWDFIEKEYKNIYSNIKVKCKFCGKINYKPAYRIIYGKCFYCNESQGERAVRLYLEKNKIRYIQEYTFKDCKYKKELPFDFYLPDYNTVIEYQGEQHFREILFFEKLEDRQLKDKIKREYCIKNGIREIEIKYNEKLLIFHWMKKRTAYGFLSRSRRKSQKMRYGIQI